jgi:5-methylcytosine-specific restriction endonuclease McrBC regulatory subunit McrC
MNRLFESFVTEVLKSAAPPGFEVEAQGGLNLDDAGTIAMRPDVMLLEGGERRAVVDCKYKVLSHCRRGLETPTRTNCSRTARQQG